MAAGFGTYHHMYVCRRTSSEVTCNRIIYLPEGQKGQLELTVGLTKIEGEGIAA